MNAKRAKKLRRMARAICANDQSQIGKVYKRLKTIKPNKSSKQ